MNIRFSLIAAPFALSLAAVPAAFAQHAGDIGIAIVDDHMATGQYVTGVFQPGERVFGVTFGELFPNYASNPGYDSLPAIFPVPSSISFSVLAALREWDGCAFGSTIPPERISIGFGPVTPVLTPLSDVRTPGFSLAVGSNGEWHRHLEYTLQTPASDGIYLMQMSLAGSAPSMQESLPFFLVFNQNRPQSEQDAAITWVRRNVVAAGCVADLDDGSGMGQPDGGVDINDMLYFLGQYEQGLCGADLDGGDGNGVPDGGVDINDLLFFLAHYEAGC